MNNIILPQAAIDGMDDMLSFVDTTIETEVLMDFLEEELNNTTLDNDTDAMDGE